MSTQIGTVIDGKYEILKQIGKGGMSTVYLAMDKRLNKQWAVKEIKRTGFGKNNEQIVNEVPADAEMMKKLDHPAIPRIVDIIDHKSDEFIYVVMDYVEGESLDKVLKEYGAQPQDLVIEWAKQICDALGYLHSQKPPIIYRDMKPANVMLKPEGNIKIIDFGIAREYKEANLADTTVLGTRGYASPEHYGSRQTDERSDIYTIGMTMHHLLTGVDPRPADYIYAPIRQWNPELSGGLERIIDKCVSPDPKDRYQNCNELLYALDHYTEEEDSYKKKQRNKLFMFLISSLLVVILSIVGLVTMNLSQQAESNNYDTLVEITDLDYDTAMTNIETAIKIDKDNHTAYENFLSYIIADYNITEKEYNGFRTIYNAQKGVNENFKKEFAELSYEAGKNTFFYYDVNEKPEEIKTRAIKAKNYLENTVGEKFEGSNIANDLYTICEFYSTDPNSVEGTDYSKISDVLNSIDECIDDLDSYNKSDSVFIKAMMYRSALDFINSNSSDIADPNKGNVDESVITDLLDKIESKSDSLQLDVDNNDRAKESIDYISDNIDSFRNSIINYYNSKEE